MIHTWKVDHWLDQRCTIDNWHEGSSQWGIYYKHDPFKIFRAILVYNKLILSNCYQLTDSTPKKFHPVCDRICPVCVTIYAEVLVQSNKYLINNKRTSK